MNFPENSETIFWVWFFESLWKVAMAFVIGVGSIVLPTAVVAFAVHKITGDESKTLAAIAICMVLAAAFLS